MLANRINKGNEIEMYQPPINFNELRWDGTTNPEPDRAFVQISQDAKPELEIANIDVYVLIDMLDCCFQCHEPRRVAADEIEVCSNRSHTCYRIILFKDFCIDVQAFCWVVKHVKPV